MKTTYDPTSAHAERKLLICYGCKANIAPSQSRWHTSGNVMVPLCTECDRKARSNSKQ